MWITNFSTEYFMLRKVIKTVDKLLIVTWPKLAMYAFIKMNCGHEYEHMSIAEYLSMRCTVMWQVLSLRLCLYVCMYVCMYLCMYVCM